MFNSKHVKKELVASCDFQHYPYGRSRQLLYKRLPSLNQFFSAKVVIFQGDSGLVFIYACGSSRREILNALLNWSDKKAKKAGEATTILVM